MKYTGIYYEPIANALHNADIFVSVVNPLLIDDYDTNRVRKVKIDRIDATKIASFALDKWLKLREYAPAEMLCKTLKIMNRQYIKLNKILMMQKNSLITLLDSCFPNANMMFSSPRRESDGYEKWGGFCAEISLCRFCCKALFIGIQNQITELVQKEPLPLQRIKSR